MSPNGDRPESPAADRDLVCVGGWAAGHREPFLRAPARDAGDDNETPSEGLALLPGNL